MGKLVPAEQTSGSTEDTSFQVSDFVQDRAKETIKQMTGVQSKKRKKNQAVDNDTQTMMTLATKSVFANARDEAINAMYERKISIRDLQIWLRRNRSSPTLRLN